MFNAIRLVSRQTPSAVVVGIFADKKLDPATKKLDTDGSIARAIDRVETSGESGKIAECYPTAKNAPARVIIVGLGKRESFQPSSLRSVAGALGRRAAANKDERIELHLGPALETIPKLDIEHAGRCLGEGFGLLGWKNWLFKGTGHGDAPKRTALNISCPTAALASGIEVGLALAESTNFARDLSETPPNIATTGYMAEAARKLAKKTGLKCTVLEGKDLEREKLIGHINVGKASENKPCMIRLEYRPKNARKNAKPAVLVGKTMTYDTGGLSLKINNGMVGMKRDKDGGCAVLGAMHAIATVIKPNRPVVALLACAENSISDEAYRPDDVITYRNGVTVEVTNTDAEGRLVLADALIWACEVEKPEFIVDLATLTGGVITALGSTFAGMFCEDEKLREKLTRAMQTSGERWWRLPMDQEYRDMMKSPIADVVNSNPNRKAHPIQGAAFLSFFVQPKVAWAHIDIAGVHVSESDSGCWVKGPTGWGVRLLADLLSE
ncbi:MAG: leucyl aminopeptidase family protein [Phycisphaerales bacterium]|nr:leucyl aminopeptidase family protein [Phycisphaerales bacterium]